MPFDFRSLPPLAKKYVLQMLYIDLPVTAKSLEERVLADGLSKHKVAIDRLLQLRIFLESVDRYEAFSLSKAKAFPVVVLSYKQLDWINVLHFSKINS